MNRKSKLFTSSLLALVMVFTISCSIFSGKSSDGEIEETEAEQQVIYVTATPKPVESTSLENVEVKTCLVTNDCYDAIDLHDRLNSENGKTYETTLSVGSSVRVSQGWYAKNDTTLTQNLNNMEWVLTIDGVDYFKRIFLVDGTTSGIVGENSGKYPGKWIDVVIDGFTTPGTHTIVAGYTILDEINDGFEDFPAGDHFVTYVITFE